MNWYLSFQEYFKEYLSERVWALLENMFILQQPLYLLFTVQLQEVYHRDRFPELDDVIGLVAVATRHLVWLKQGIKKSRWKFYCNNGSEEKNDFLPQ